MSKSAAAPCTRAPPSAPSSKLSLPHHRSESPFTNGVRFGGLGCEHAAEELGPLARLSVPYLPIYRLASASQAHRLRGQRQARASKPSDSHCSAAHTC